MFHISLARSRQLDVLVITVFAVVYLGMMIGRLPGLAIDRAGIALLGAIAVILITGSSINDSVAALDAPTLALLFGLMVVSAQFRISGAYTWITRRLTSNRIGFNSILAVVVLTSGGLSALLANDIIALATAPILVEVASARRINPVPLLLGLAAGANIGSAATLIGNPQNILIGQSLGMDFAAYLLTAVVPSLVGLTAAWATLAFAYRHHRWASAETHSVTESVPFDLAETIKGTVVLTGLMVVFLGGWWPRELVTLAAAGLLLLNRRVATRRFVALIDWQLLLLGLFVLNAALRDTGAPARAADWLGSAGADPNNPTWLFVSAVFLSNLVSNVPAVMLLLPYAGSSSHGAVLALASTLAGNMFIVSSIANIIVIEQAARRGVEISWLQHARTGVPITVVSLALAAIWLIAFW